MQNVQGLEKGIDQTFPCGDNADIHYAFCKSSQVKLYLYSTSSQQKLSHDTQHLVCLDHTLLFLIYLKY